MKTIRTLYVLLFSFLILNPCIQALDGGPARLMALGEPELVVIDRSIEVNLYGAGFTSSIFKKRQENSWNEFFIYQNEYFWNLANDPTIQSNKINTNIYNSGYTDQPLKNSFVIYPDKDFALIFKPHFFSKNSLSTSYTNTVNNSSSGEAYIYALEVEAAKKFGKNFAISCMLGGLNLSGENKMGNNISNYQNVEPEFNISASFLPEVNSGCDFAIRFGNDDRSMRRINTDKLIPEYIFADTNYYSSLNGMYSVNYPDKSDSITLTKTALSMSAYDYYLKAGTAYKNAGNEFTIDLGIWGSPSVTRNIKYSYIDIKTGNESSYTNSSIYNKYNIGGIIDCKYRLIFKDFIFGASVDLNSLYTALDENSTGLDLDINKYYGRAIVGINYTGIKGLLVPLECFYETNVMRSTDNDWNYDLIIYDYGANLGLEYSITNEFKIRLGTIIGKCISSNDSGAAGTIPSYTVMGGIGYKITSFEINIGAALNKLIFQKNEWYDNIGTTRLNLFIDLSEKL